MYPHLQQEPPPDVRDGGVTGIRAESLGSASFRRLHGVGMSYVSGSMYKGIASEDLVIRMGRAGLLGFFGTGGLKLARIESGVARIGEALGGDRSFGANLLCNPVDPALEEATVDLFLRHGVERVEAAAFTQLTPALVRYRVLGVESTPDGSVRSRHHILAKVSRPEVATQFLSPPPEKILQRLVAAGKIRPDAAERSRHIPMCDDLCVEADSGGHTDNGVALALMPVMLRLRDDLRRRHGFAQPIHVGEAGGLGTPHAIAAAFVLGADFVLTGSVNQCTVEAGTSDLVKDLLAGMQVQDTQMAPAGDMFEIGAKVQVMSKGVFFPARANKLFDLYKQYDSLEAIDPKTREQLETRYFKRTFDDIWRETRDHYIQSAPEQIARAERLPKFKMALVFRWYFVHTSRMALRGVAESKVDFQIHCGPALGAFNQWVKGSRLEDWRARHPDEIAQMLMTGAAEILDLRFRQFHGNAESGEALNRLDPGS